MRKNVLLIDESTTIHKIVDLTLDKQGYDLFSAYTLDESIKAYEQSQPSIVLIDNKLFSEASEEFLAYLRSVSGNIGIILLVGAYDQFMDLDIEHSLIDDYLVKPFNSIVLNQMISNILTKKGRYAAAYAPTSQKSDGVILSAVPEVDSAVLTQDTDDLDTVASDTLPTEKLPDDPKMDIPEVADVALNPTFDEDGNLVDSLADSDTAISSDLLSDGSHEFATISSEESPAKITEELSLAEMLMGLDDEVLTAISDDDQTPNKAKPLEEQLIDAVVLEPHEVPVTDSLDQLDDVNTTTLENMQNAELPIDVEALIEEVPEVSAEIPLNGTDSVTEPITEINIDESPVHLGGSEQSEIVAPENTELQGLDHPHELVNNIDGVIVSDNPSHLVNDSDIESFMDSFHGDLNNASSEEAVAINNFAQDLEHEIIAKHDDGNVMQDTTSIDGLNNDNVAVPEEVQLAPNMNNASFDALADNLLENLGDIQHAPLDSATVMNNIEEPAAITDTAVNEQSGQPQSGAELVSQVFEPAIDDIIPSVVPNAVAGDNAENSGQVTGERRELMNLFDEMNFNFEQARADGDELMPRTELGSMGGNAQNRSASLVVNPELGAGSPAKLTIELSQENLVRLLGQPINQGLLESIISNTLYSSIGETVSKLVPELAEKLVKEELKLIKGK